MIRNNVVHGPQEVSIPAHLNFGQFCFDQFKSYGNDTAQICADTGHTTTFCEIVQHSVNLATSLRQLGVQRGDVISISSENRFEFTITALAVMYTGAKLATLNIMYTPEELTHSLNLTKPRFIFSTPISAFNLDSVIKDFPCVQSLILYGEEKLVPGLLYNDLVRTDVNVDDFVLTDVNGKQDTLAIMASSGTTGLPKGVELTHVNFLVLAHHYKYYLERCAKGREMKCMMSLIPWFHAYGFLSHLSVMSLRMRVVFMVRFDEEGYLRALQDYKVNLTLIVPPIAVFFAKHPLVAKYKYPALNTVWCGAAPLSRSVSQAASKRIGVDFIRQGYGFTEMTMACMVDLSDGEKEGACGTPAPGMRVKVVDTRTGKSLGPMKEGELFFKSPLEMKGYVGDKASGDALYDAEGYVRSGDVGYYDGDGYFYIVDRLKELIKYKGFQVAPAELEAVLLQHGSVREAGVVGLPNEQAGELPLAFVVLQPGSRSNPDEIVSFVADKVSPAKRLRGGVVFVPEIPKNASGKILRRELRAMLKQHLQTKSKL